MSHPVVTVDVREDLKNGGEPFSRIMSAVDALKPGEQLRLIVPFEPIPLLRVMQTRGFQYSGQANESGDWEVLFTRTDEPVRQVKSPEPETAHDQRLLKLAAPTILDLDARGLEPPQPLIMILEAAATMPANAELRARTDRRPLHLYPQLEERGFTAETKEQSDGSFLTHIRRR